MEGEIAVQQLLHGLAQHLVDNDMLTVIIELGIDTATYNNLRTDKHRNGGIIEANFELLRRFWQNVQRTPASKFELLESALRAAGRNDLRGEIRRRKQDIITLLVQENQTERGHDREQPSGPVYQTAQPTPPPAPGPHPGVPPPAYDQHYENILVPPPVYPYVPPTMTAVQPTYRILTDKNVVFVSARIGAEYTKLATFLGIPYNEIQLLTMQHRSVKQLIIDMLVQWRNTANATDIKEELKLQTRLKEALSRSGRNDLAQTVASWKAPPNFEFADERGQETPTRTTNNYSAGGRPDLSSSSSHGTRYASTANSDRTQGEDITDRGSGIQSGPVHGTHIPSQQTATPIRSFPQHGADHVSQPPQPHTGDPRTYSSRTSVNVGHTGHASNTAHPSNSTNPSRSVDVHPSGQQVTHLFGQPTATRAPAGVQCTEDLEVAQRGFGMDVDPQQHYTISNNGGITESEFNKAMDLREDDQPPQ